MLKTKDLCWEFAFTFHPPKHISNINPTKSTTNQSWPRQHSWQPFCQPCVSLWILGKKRTLAGSNLLSRNWANSPALFRERNGRCCQGFGSFWVWSECNSDFYNFDLFSSFEGCLNQFQTVFLIDLRQIPSCKDVHLFTQVNRLLVKRMTVGQAAVSKLSKWQILSISTLMMWALFATWHALAGMEWNDYVLGGKLLLDHLPNQHATWKHKTSLVKDNKLGMETASFDPKFFATQTTAQISRHFCWTFTLTSFCRIEHVEACSRFLIRLHYPVKSHNRRVGCLVVSDNFEGWSFQSSKSSIERWPSADFLPASVTWLPWWDAIDPWDAMPERWPKKLPGSFAKNRPKKKVCVLKNIWKTYCQHPKRQNSRLPSIIFQEAELLNFGGGASATSWW